MNPVRGYTMLNFLHWVALHRPEVRRLRGLSREALLSLANDFERGALQSNEILRAKWESGFYTLLEGESNWEGYDVARRELEAMESRTR